MRSKPSHYFVVRSPYAQLLLTDVKTFEWRTNANVFANKRLAISVSKSLAKEEYLQEDIAYWWKRFRRTLRNMTGSKRDAAFADFRNICAKAGRLFDRSNGCGMIIGEIVTGNATDYDGDYGIPVLKFKLWPESEWIKSPGGLGVRPLPVRKRIGKK